MYDATTLSKDRSCADQSSLITERTWLRLIAVSPFNQWESKMIRLHYVHKISFIQLQEIREWITKLSIIERIQLSNRTRSSSNCHNTIICLFFSLQSIVLSLCTALAFIVRLSFGSKEDPLLWAAEHTVCRKKCAIVSELTQYATS